MADPLPTSVAASPLFLLPREIRDTIYALCLTSPAPVEWPSATPPVDLHPQLVRTCSIIHREATPLLYTLNSFTWDHPSNANMFVRAMADPRLASHITNLTFHIRAQDTRLWMPYITSRDQKRSLYADFTRLNELNVRFRSTKWTHTLPAEANLNLWHEDSRLEELLDGLKDLYVPPDPAAAGSDRMVIVRSERRPPVPMGLTTTITAIRPVVVKVVCSCRVHVSHFRQLTRAASPPTFTGNTGNMGTNNGSIPTNAGAAPEFGMPHPHVPNARFSGFHPIDLRTGGTKELHDPEQGTVRVAQTFFAEKEGILLSLEIHCCERGDRGGGS